MCMDLGSWAACGRRHLEVDLVGKGLVVERRLAVSVCLVAVLPWLRSLCLECQRFEHVSWVLTCSSHGFAVGRTYCLGFGCRNDLYSSELLPSTFQQFKLRGLHHSLPQQQRRALHPQRALHQAACYATADVSTLLEGEEGVYDDCSGVPT